MADQQSATVAPATIQNDVPGDEHPIPASIFSPYPATPLAADRPSYWYNPSTNTYDKIIDKRSHEERIIFVQPGGLRFTAAEIEARSAGATSTLIPPTSLPVTVDFFAVVGKATNSDTTTSTRTNGRKRTSTSSEQVITAYSTGTQPNITPDESPPPKKLKLKITYKNLAAGLVAERREREVDGELDVGDELSEEAEEEREGEEGQDGKEGKKEEDEDKGEKEEDKEEEEEQTEKGKEKEEPWMSDEQHCSVLKWLDGLRVKRVGD